MLRMRSCAFDLVLSSGFGPLGEALDFTGWFPLWFKNLWLADFFLFGYRSCPGEKEEMLWVSLVLNSLPAREGMLCLFGTELFEGLSLSIHAKR